METLTIIPITILILIIIYAIITTRQEPSDEELKQKDPIKYYIKHAPKGAGMKNINITLDTLNKITQNPTKYKIIKLKIDDNRVIDKVTGKPFNPKAINHATCNVYYKLQPEQEYITHTTHQILQINTYTIHTPNKKTTTNKGPNIINIK